MVSQNLMRGAAVPSGSVRRIPQLDASGGQRVPDGVGSRVRTILAQRVPQGDQRLDRWPEAVGRIGEALFRSPAEPRYQAAQHRPGPVGVLVLVRVSRPGLDRSFQIEYGRDHRGAVAVPRGRLEPGLRVGGHLVQGPVVFRGWWTVQIGLAPAALT